MREVEKFRQRIEERALQIQKSEPKDKQTVKSKVIVPKQRLVKKMEAIKFMNSRLVMGNGGGQSGLNP